MRYNERFLIDITFGDKFAIRVGYSLQYDAAGVFIYGAKQKVHSRCGRLRSEWHWLPFYRLQERWHFTPLGKQVYWWRHQ